MFKKFVYFLCATVLLAASTNICAQVYSPQITKVGEVDTTNLKSMVQEIYKQADAHTDRQKAEAIWRFYLTDGRFVKPGMFYHIAGWAYEEPVGQVLDPIKLLNSYGFGLCYQVAPLLQATYNAGGFKNARVWFLTGHTVAEVFYDGAYHYFDSDMMGYNPIGNGALKQRDVASVYQIEHDGNIMTKNVTGPKTSNPNSVDYPWYPADVRAGDMSDIAALFTTEKDNYLYAYRRYPHGHTMDFVLRPGERMIRYFHPTPAGLFYLPYAYDGEQWKVLPDLAQFHIPIAKGPHSEKDARTVATGKIEYRPSGIGDATVSKHGETTVITFSMPSPYVIIDANFSLQASLAAANDNLIAETSIDDGRTWKQCGSLAGPFNGPWTIHPARIPVANERLNVVSGSYGYLIRFSLKSASRQTAALHDFLLTTIFQLNPRTLPTVTPGENRFDYQAANYVRKELPVKASQLNQFASKVENASYQSQDGQGFLINKNSKPANVIFTLTAKNNSSLTGFDVGGRFLDLRDGIAPNKFTAEIRKVTPWPANAKGPGTASIAWSTSSHGPWTTLWIYNPKLTWLDGQPIPQLLRWPEVDRSIRDLPAGTKRVYVRYRIDGLAIDHFRLATLRHTNPAASEHLKITQIWTENGEQKEFHKDILHASEPQQYEISASKKATIDNLALIIECPQK